jgi:CRP-like cAMP-binding protein
MDRKMFQKGALIFREGDTADCMYAVNSGRVGVYAAYGTAEEKLLAEYTQDGYFGEMGLLEHAPRSAAAVALEDNTCLEAVNEENFLVYFREHPEQVLRIMQQLSGNLRKASRDYAETCRRIAELSAEEDAK